jgi:hypothetical protein
MPEIPINEEAEYWPKLKRSSQKQNTNKRAWGRCPSMCEALGLISNTYLNNKSLSPCL